MATPVEQIKEKLDIVEFIKKYVALAPAGRNMKGLCPFHKEKSPSFMVSPERQSWHCFGCGIGGDAFSFLMRYENLEFAEALRILAELTGIELRRISPAEYKATGLLYEIQEAAKLFFTQELKKAKVVEEYLAGRGLKTETSEEFELGWAPDSSEALTLTLLSQGFAIEDLVRAGLTVKNDRGLTFDRFRGRIIFPIHNHQGRVAGFTGRILPQIEKAMAAFPGPSGFVPAKYVNSPETGIFNKSKLLYGFWKAKDAIRERGAAFLVEGQMDFLMSYQAGVKYAVASSGTAFTAEHLLALRRMTDEIILSFDADEAGWSAGERAIDLAEASDFNVRVTTLGGGFKDPADAVQADPENLTRAIEKARPAIEAYYEHYLGSETRPDFGDRDTLRKLRIVLSKLKRISSPVTRDHWLKEIARRTALTVPILAEEMERIQISVQSAATTPEAGSEKPTSERRLSRWETLTEEALALMRNSGVLTEVDVTILAPGYSEVHAAFLRGETRSADPEFDQLLERIVLRSREMMPDETQLLLTEIKREYIRERRRVLTLAIRNAEATGDTAALEAAMREIDQLRSDTTFNP